MSKLAIVEINADILRLQTLDADAVKFDSVQRPDLTIRRWI